MGGLAVTNSYRLSAAMILFAMSAMDTRADVSPGTYSIPPNVSGGVQNLRAGPGQGHGIVVAIPAGADGVQVGECRSADDGRSRYDFCRATWRGHSGWISSCCLTAAPASKAKPTYNPTAMPTDLASCRKERALCINECREDMASSDRHLCPGVCDVTVGRCERFLQ
jgi:hypothetical protein